MITMGKSPRGRGGAGSEHGFPARTHPASEKWKLLTTFALLSSLLAMGRALEPAATKVNDAAGPAVASNMATEPGRTILIALASLGMMALGAVMARLIGGSQSEGSARGGCIDFGFFRHLSDRPPFGQASGRRDGEA